MKKIALIADVKDWAFDIAANIIKKNLINDYSIDIYYAKSNEFNKDLFLILETLKDYDIIHFFWRKILLDFEDIQFKNKVIEKYGNYDQYIQNIVPKISTGIYDHLFENDLDFNKIFTKYCHSYVVSSQKLYDIYTNQNSFKKPTCIMGDSFEKEKFYPLNMQRFEFNENSPLIVGWVGNSAWNEKEKDKNGNSIDFKGFHTILKPAIDELISEGYNIKLYCADKNVKQIPNDDMNDYYSNIHIYVCVSSTEGTPKPLLEAMGCGIPVITTDVGVARQALVSKLQQEYILDERKIGENDIQIRNSLKNKLIYLYNNRNILSELSKENYEASKKYEISNMKKIYSSYFQNF